MSSRKFILALGILIFGGVLEFTHGGVSDSFVNLAGLILGIYSAGNIANKHVVGKKSTPPE